MNQDNLSPPTDFLEYQSPLLEKPLKLPTPPASILSFKQEEDDKKAIQQSFIKRNRLKLGCCFGLLLILIILIVLGVVFLHQIAQMFMNASSVHFTSIQISQPSAQSFQVRVQGGIRDAGPFNAQTNPMEIMVEHENHPLGSLFMPALQIKMGEAVFDVQSEFKIQNISAFDAFSKQLATSQEVTWRLLSKTDLKVFNYNIQNLNFDKQVPIDGMHSLPQVEIKSFNLQSKNIQDPIQVSCQTELWNPSPVEIEMGQIQFEMFYLSQSIGLVSAENVTLKSGHNEMLLKGQLLKSNTADHYSDMFTKYIHQENIQVQVKGMNQSMNNSTISYLQAALESLLLQVQLPLQKDLKLIQKMALDGIDLDFTKQSSPFLTIDNILVDIKMPFDFPIQIQSNSQKFQLYKNDQLFASSSSGWLPASNQQNPNQLQTKLPQTQLQVQTQQMASFLTEMFTSDKGTFLMKGTADVKAMTQLGLVTLTDVPFEQQQELKGMQSLNVFKPGESSNPVLLTMQVKRGTKEYIEMESNLILYSASNVAVHLGDIYLDLMTESQKIGVSLLRNLTVLPGANQILSSSYFQPQSDQQKQTGRQLISKYMTGQVNILNFKGNYDLSTKNELLKESISKLFLTAPLAGLTTKIVQSAEMKLNPLTTVFTKAGTSQFQVQNPFEDSFQVMSIQAQIDFQQQPLAKMEESQSFAVSPLKQSQSPALPVTLLKVLSPDALKALGKGLTNQLWVDIPQSVIVAQLGQYPMTVDYHQSAIPTKIDFF